MQQEVDKQVSEIPSAKNAPFGVVFRVLFSMKKTLIHETFGLISNAGDKESQVVFHCLSDAPHDAEANHNGFVVAIKHITQLFAATPFNLLHITHYYSHSNNADSIKPLGRGAC